jgi:hypothetical protein
VVAARAGALEIRLETTSPGIEGGLGDEAQGDEALPVGHREAKAPFVAVAIPVGGAGDAAGVEADVPPGPAEGQLDAEVRLEGAAEAVPADPDALPADLLAEVDAVVVVAVDHRPAVVPGCAGQAAVAGVKGAGLEQLETTPRRALRVGLAGDVAEAAVRWRKAPVPIARAAAATGSDRDRAGDEENAEKHGGAGR